MTQITASMATIKSCDIFSAQDKLGRRYNKRYLQIVAKDKLKKLT